MVQSVSILLFYVVCDTNVIVPCDEHLSEVESWWGSGEFILFTFYTQFSLLCCKWKQLIISKDALLTNKHQIKIGVCYVIGESMTSLFVWAYV